MSVECMDGAYIKLLIVVESAMLLRSSVGVLVSSVVLCCVIRSLNMEAVIVLGR